MKYHNVDSLTIKVTDRKKLQYYRKNRIRKLNSIESIRYRNYEKSNPHMLFIGYDNYYYDKLYENNSYYFSFITSGNFFTNTAYCPENILELIEYTIIPELVVDAGFEHDQILCQNQLILSEEAIAAIGYEGEKYELIVINATKKYFLLLPTQIDIIDDEKSLYLNTYYDEAGRSEIFKKDLIIPYVIHGAYESIFCIKYLDYKIDSGLAILDRSDYKAHNQIKEFMKNQKMEYKVHPSFYMDYETYKKVKNADLKSVRLCNKFVRSDKNIDSKLYVFSKDKFSLLNESEENCTTISFEKTKEKNRIERLKDILYFNGRTDIFIILFVFFLIATYIYNFQTNIICYVLGFVLLLFLLIIASGIIMQISQMASIFTLPKYITDLTNKTMQINNKSIKISDEDFEIYLLRNFTFYGTFKNELSSDFYLGSCIFNGVIDTRADNSLIGAELSELHLFLVDEVE